MHLIQTQTILGDVEIFVLAALVAALEHVPVHVPGAVLEAVVVAAKAIFRPTLID